MGLLEKWCHFRTGPAIAGDFLFCSTAEAALKLNIKRVSRRFDAVGLTKRVFNGRYLAIFGLRPELLNVGYRIDLENLPSQGKSIPLDNSRDKILLFMPTGAETGLSFMLSSIQQFYHRIGICTVATELIASMFL